MACVIDDCVDVPTGTKRQRLRTQWRRINPNIGILLDLRNIDITDNHLLLCISSWRSGREEVLG